MTLYSNARECLHAVVKRYSEIRTYTDIGFVRPRDGGFPSCWFESAYESPNRYRFKFVTAHPFRPLRHVTTTTILGSNGENGYYFTQYPRLAPQFESCRSLASAINRAAGVSQGTSRTISQLLLPGVRGVAPTNLHRLRFRRSREIDGVLCYCISGINPRGERLTFWVGVNDLLIRKLISHAFRHEEVRTNISVNHVLTDDVFSVPQAET